jgi:tetratricopeptide (TPR) repeat protein
MEHMKKLPATALLIMLSLLVPGVLPGCGPSAETPRSGEQAPLPPQTQEHFNRAQKYLQENKLPEALAEFQQVTRQAPEAPLGHLWLGKVYLSQKKAPQAEAEFKKALALDPKNYTAMILLGRLYSQEPGRLKLAEDYLKQALALSPDNVEAHFDLGRVYALQGKRQKAIEAFNFIFFKEREFHLYHYEVARILEGWGQRAEALRQYRQALFFNPNLAEAKAALQRLEAEARAQQPAGAPGKPPQKPASKKAKK